MNLNLNASSNHGVQNFSTENSGLLSKGVYPLFESDNTTNILSLKFFSSKSIETQTHPAFAAVANLVPESFPTLRTIYRVAMAILSPLTLIATGVTAIAKSFQGGETKHEEVPLIPNPLYGGSQTWQLNPLYASNKEAPFSYQEPPPIGDPEVEYAMPYGPQEDFYPSQLNGLSIGADYATAAPPTNANYLDIASERNNAIYEKIVTKAGSNETAFDPTYYSEQLTSFTKKCAQNKLTFQDGKVNVTRADEKNFTELLQKQPLGFPVSVRYSFKTDGKTTKEHRIYINKRDLIGNTTYTFYNVTQTKDGNSKVKLHSSTINGQVSDTHRNIQSNKKEEVYTAEQMKKLPQAILFLYEAQQKISGNQDISFAINPNQPNNRFFYALPEAKDVDGLFNARPLYSVPNTKGGGD